MGATRAHRAMRAQALTRWAASNAVRFSADPATRSYRVDRATAPTQLAYNLAQCMTYFPGNPPALRTNNAEAAESISAAAVDCPVDIVAVILQRYHPALAAPHTVRLQMSDVTYTFTLDHHEIDVTSQAATQSGAQLIAVTGKQSHALTSALTTTVAALCPPSHSASSTR